MENFTLQDIFAIARRRLWILVVALVVGVAGTLAYLQTVDNVYRAQARILVESQIIPSELARSTVDRSVGERVALIRQRLFTRQNLLDIARSLNVFPDAEEMSPTDIVDEMRRAGSISGDQAGRRRNTSITSVNISFRSPSPEIAARVANELVSRVIAQNVEQRTSQAQGTLAFFDAEVDRLAAELDAQSRRIADFQTENQDALPASLAGRQRELSELRQTTFQRGFEREVIESEIATLREQIEIGLADSDSGSPQSRELTQLRTRLALQRATLSETHPSIRLLTARIDALETLLEGDPASGGSGDGQASRQLARIEELEQRLARMAERDARDFERMAELEDSIARTPEVELALNALRRNFGGLQSQYNEAIAKRAQAETGERLESTQQAERFEIIEQALPPESPVAPNRRLILAAGVGMSGMVGFGIIVLLELLNRSLRTARDFERELQILPIGVIPYIATGAETAIRRWSIRIGALVVLLGGAAAIVAVDQFVAPLPLLFERLAERIGF